MHYNDDKMCLFVCNLRYRDVGKSTVYRIVQRCKWGVFVLQTKHETVLIGSDLIYLLYSGEFF